MEKTDNELIAEFMGGIRDKNGDKMYLMPNGIGPYKADVYSVYELIYDTSWDYLMPVVEKIEEELLFQVEIHTAYTNINGELNATKYNQYSCFEAQSDTKLIVTYRAVLSFIKWYNSQKQ